MEIRLAETAGFCFGVDRAVKLCERLLDEGKKVATLGPIIHNDGVVADLAARGCTIVDAPGETPPGAVLVIRSHGVPKAVLEECSALGLQVEDATCPFVSKIHRIVEQAGKEGRHVVVAGSPEHHEVLGIVGHCSGPCDVVGSAEGLQELSFPHDTPVTLVAQTTFSMGKYDEIKACAKKYYTNLTVFDTICSATNKRQTEAAQLAKDSDCCVVIGGHNSSNTQKLKEVCEQFAPTFRIENAGELKPGMLAGYQKIGVTAGASTPYLVIKEVLTRMSEINQELDFETMMEESLKPVHRGQRVEGTVIEVRPNEVVVDIGRKQTGIVPMDELLDDASMDPEEAVKLGETYTFQVSKVEDEKGIVTLSRKRVANETSMAELMAAYENGEPVDAYITGISKKDNVSKGLVANVKGVRVFIPGGQATLRRGESFDELLHTTQKILITKVEKERKSVIGSIRAVLEGDQAKKREEFFKTVEVGKEYKGTVKSLENYGAFVDLGGVDGMVHVSELSWKRIHNPAEVLKVGDEITVFVKDFDKEKGRISLGYRREEDNPWNLIKSYEIGSEFEAPIVSVTKFGAFARILPDLDGLIHLSELSTEHVDDPTKIVKVGDVVKVRLIGVDEEKKRISLSMLAEGEKEAARAAKRAAKDAEKEESADEQPVEE
ncbi:MAG: bifunctional 4-hydroxy-3-methylbut-2-enyl diphosphate reductase/30S ribosomal protein S1 [Oscillospiraceae bacterium]|nr:bifunctional 4-hydroxy-3-methylbut-2-enyl diphosphate reductase/30S ribosomal protein S1 [Oscillospiraceae bacterium]